MQVDSKQRLQTAQWLLERQLAWISASDVKVAVILTIQLGLLGGLAAGMAVSQTRPLWAMVFTVVSAALSALSVFCAALAVKPDTDGPKASLFFFGLVAKLDQQTYVERLKTTSDEDLLADWGAQIHRNAEIAAKKYRWVGASMKWGFLAAVAWLPAIALLFKIGA